MAEDDDIPLTGAIREKLVATKQAWARAGRLLTGVHGNPAVDRLPPGQTLVQDWPVLDLGVQDTGPDGTGWALHLRGAELETADGRVLLDCLSGAGTLALGHNHPEVVDAIRAALDSGVPLHALDLATLRAGIWGRESGPATSLRDRDRVEIYRALVVDPKEARRLRYRNHRDRAPRG